MQKATKPVPRCAWTVDEFCQSHSISRGTFYNILRGPDAPKIMKVGGRTLVSDEAATAWRRRMEDAAAK